MNTSKLADVAEIIAAVGVILSLLFVGFQIRDGNIETRAATVQAVMDSEMYFQAQALQHADTWENLTSGAPLSSGIDTRKAVVLFNMLMTLNENRLHQFESGYIDYQLEAIAPMLNLPVFDIWRGQPGAMVRSPEFLERLDSMRERGAVE